LVRFRVTFRQPYGDAEVEGESVEEILENLRGLRKIAEQAAEILEAEAPEAKAQASVAVARVKRRRGKSEAVVALENIETYLLPSKFFSQPRSTAEVRQKLKEITGITFQSRKVSQALGILYKSNKLSRTGVKGNYKYFKKP
jgi:vacuolar-type H+-ATPase subunit I/STV1